MKHALLDWRPWLLLYALQVPALRALVKYLPEALYALIPLYYIVAFVGYAWLLRTNKLAKLFESRALFVGLIALHVALNVIIYPQADVLKYQNQGSTQDDAMIIAGERMANGLNPYEGRTLKNEELTPGPAWVALALPFSLSGLYVLLLPFWIALTAWIIQRKLSLGAATLFLILCFSSPTVWELSVTGSDMLALGCAFYVMLIVCYAAWTRGNWWMKTHAAIFAGAVCTSRIVYGYLLFLISGFLLRRNVTTAFAFGAAAVLAFVLFQAPFYLWNPDAYFPLHRYELAKGWLGPVLEVVALISTILTLVYLALRTKLDEYEWIKGALISLLVTMFWSALGELRGRENVLTLWEGANYFGVLIPLAVVFVILNTEQGRSRPAGSFE